MKKATKKRNQTKILKIQKAQNILLMMTLLLPEIRITINIMKKLKILNITQILKKMKILKFLKVQQILKKPKIT